MYAIRSYYEQKILRKNSEIAAENRERFEEGGVDFARRVDPDMAILDAGPGLFPDEVVATSGPRTLRITSYNVCYTKLLRYYKYRLPYHFKI